MRRNGMVWIMRVLLILCIGCIIGANGETTFSDPGVETAAVLELETALPENRAENAPIGESDSDATDADWMAAAGNRETLKPVKQTAVTENEDTQANGLDTFRDSVNAELAAFSRTARNITGSCTFKLCARPGNDKMITDGAYTTYWDSYTSYNPWVIIRSEEPMYGLYLCFRKMPESFEIQVPGTENGEWIPLMEGDTRFHHTFYELNGLTELRIYSTQKDTHQMGFNEIFVFSKGDVPEWVQRWEPTEEKADILFLSAHPDDEILFYGGAIPTYAAEQEKRVVVAYLSYSNKTRRSETLNGLWTMGVRHYPVFGGFKDSWSNKLSKAYQKAGEKKVLMWVTEMYRKYQPEVVVTLDLKGEYGHGQHKMIADAAIKCYDLAANPEKYPESYSLYGIWQAKKLYVHLWGEEEDQTLFDWNIPLESMEGRTGMEVAKEAYAMHVTQTFASFKIGKKWHVMSVEETGTMYSNTTFGLYASQVGPDETHTDFLEHIENN